jgi:hypothetical protein
MVYETDLLPATKPYGAEVPPPTATRIVYVPATSGLIESFTVEDPVTPVAVTGILVISVEAMAALPIGVVEDDVAGVPVVPVPAAKVKIAFVDVAGAAVICAVTVYESDSAR